MLTTNGYYIASGAICCGSIPDFANKPMIQAAVVEREWKPMPNESNDNFAYGVCGCILPFAIQEFKNSLCDDELRSILSKHLGERDGQVETYQQCLRRIIAERDMCYVKPEPQLFANCGMSQEKEKEKEESKQQILNPFYQKG